MSDARRDAAAADVARLGALVVERLAAALDGAREVALVDFPNHMNIGDAAIWLGELAALRALGVRIVYTCDQRSYVREHLAAALSDDGAILLHGGGNFGDLYPRHQRLRERVLADFRGRRIVQLPQTIAHAGAGTAQRVRQLIQRHGEVRMLARDGLTRDWIAAELELDASLCPDSAMCLGWRPGPADGGVLWLARRDDESAVAAGATVPAGVERCDWPGERGAWRARRLTSRVLSYATSAEPTLGRLLRPVATAAYPRLAAERVGTGMELIGSARSVVTDRLHAHILCLLCGVPHVLRDNSTGKLRTYYETWSSDVSLTHWADDEPQAFELAGALAAA